jgi:hypothetical protein
MKRLPKILIFFLACLFSAGLHADPSVAPWRNSLVAFLNPYQSVLAKYTRTSKHYSFNQLDTDYHWVATYHSPELMNAVDDLLKKYYPDGLSPFALQLREAMAPKDQTEFFVAVYARSLQLKRMVGKKNLWAVQLIAGGEILKPVSVEEVELSPMFYQLYPYLTKWHKGFRVIFPFNSIASPGQKLTLEISGPLGSHQAVFNKS